MQHAGIADDRQAPDPCCRYGHCRVQSRASTYPTPAAINREATGCCVITLPAAPLGAEAGLRLETLPKVRLFRRRWDGRFETPLVGTGASLATSA